MSCSSNDWKAYVLGELDPSDRRQAEAHAATCSICREELAAVRLTLDALSTLREEEIPRRIAFVSDKVFEPRWWQSFLRPSFAAACVIAAAILVHAFVRPAAPIPPAELQASIDRAVNKAVIAVEQRQAQQTADLQAAYDILNKQITRSYVVNAGLVRQ
jgi:anti-sigma factor RsiW